MPTTPGRSEPFSFSLRAPPPSSPYRRAQWSYRYIGISIVLKSFPGRFKKHLCIHIQTFTHSSLVPLVQCYPWRIGWRGRGVIEETGFSPLIKPWFSPLNGRVFTDYSFLLLLLHRGINQPEKHRWRRFRHHRPRTSPVPAAAVTSTRLPYRLKSKKWPPRPI